MATNYLRGVNAALTVQWTEYAGGPATDVTGLTITITRVTGSVIVVGPTSTGVTHVATGLDLYNWASADDAALGDYAVVWNGLDTDGDAVQASEVITLVTSTVTVTVDDVIEYIGADSALRLAVVVGDATTYPKIEDAIAAETRAQRKRVRYPTDDVDGLADLRNALLRRVQRNLAMRALPLAMQVISETGTIARPGGNDPEIRRLEAPYPRLVVG